MPWHLGGDWQGAPLPGRAARTTLVSTPYGCPLDRSVLRCCKLPRLPLVMRPLRVASHAWVFALNGFCSGEFAGRLRDGVSGVGAALCLTAPVQAGAWWRASDLGFQDWGLG